MRVQNIPPKPVFIFDGDCGFCKGWVDRWHAAVGDAVEFRAAPECARPRAQQLPSAIKAAVSPELSSLTAPDTQFPEIDPSAYQRASVFVDRDGSVFVGSEAVFRMFAYAPAKRHW